MTRLESHVQQQSDHPFDAEGGGSVRFRSIGTYRSVEFDLLVTLSPRFTGRSTSADGVQASLFNGFGCLGVRVEKSNCIGGVLNQTTALCVGEEFYETLSFASYDFRREMARGLLCRSGFGANPSHVTPASPSPVECDRGRRDIAPQLGKSHSSSASGMLDPNGVSYCDCTRVRLVRSGTEELLPAIDR